MNNTWIYTTTESFELSEILGFDEEKGYQIDSSATGEENYDKLIISRNGRTAAKIIEYSMREGREIQVKNKLCFNPMCSVSGDFSDRYKENLIRKLLKEGLFVAEDSGNGIKQHFPNTPAIMGTPMITNCYSVRYNERF